MGFRHWVRAIESQEAAFRLSPASNLETFLRIAWSLPDVRQLDASLKDEDARSLLASRLFRLAQSDIDLQYRHPEDAPMAIYVWLLNRNSRETALLAAQAVLGATNVSWADVVARKVLSDSCPVVETQTDDRAFVVDVSLLKTGLWLYDDPINSLPSLIGGQPLIAAIVNFSCPEEPEKVHAIRFLRGYDRRVLSLQPRTSQAIVRHFNEFLRFANASAEGSG